MNGNPKLNLAFVANLFDKHPSIEQDISNRAQARAHEIEAAHRAKLAREEEEMRERWKKEEAEFRARMEAEEKALRGRLEHEQRQHGERMQKEVTDLNQQKDEIEKARQELAKQQVIYLFIYSFFQRKDEKRFEFSKKKKG